MFSSFKERLNTSLSTLHEKGVTNSTGIPTATTATTYTTSTTTTTTATTTAADNNTSTTSTFTNTTHDATMEDTSSPLNSVSSPHSPTPSQGSFVSIASRISGGVSSASSSSLFFRRPLQSSRTSVDLLAAVALGTGSGTDAGSSSSSGTNSNKLAILVQKLTLDPKEEKVDPAELERIREQQPAGTELSEAMIEKLEILQRYEARFPDLASAFKKIVQEKIAAEAVLKATTALEDLGDTEALEAHMNNMSHKNEMSMQEIRRLSDQLRAKQAEVASQSAIIHDLRNQLTSRDEEIERLKLREFSLGDASDTASINEFERQSDIDTHVNNSFDDLTAILRPTSTPSPPPHQSLHEIPQSPVPRTLSPGIGMKPKKVKDQNKNQALRELMIRLENVLREKNQAIEDKEDTLDEMNQIRAQLDDELSSKKKMAERIDQLQTTISILENRLRQEVITRTSLEFQQQHQQQQLEESVVFRRASLTKTQRTSEDSDTSAITDDSILLQEELSAARLELQSVLKRESEVTRTKYEIESNLAHVQRAHDSLRHSLDLTEKRLEVANTQIEEMQELRSKLGKVSQELMESQEEIKEKQQLLNLERQWREEAEKNRDDSKRLQDNTIKDLNQEITLSKTRLAELEQELSQVARKSSNVDASDYSSEQSLLQERISSLELQISELTKERQVLEKAMLEASEVPTILSNKVEEMSKLVESLSAEKDGLNASLLEQQALVIELQNKSDAANKVISELRDQDNVASNRIRELETKLGNTAQQRSKDSDSAENGLEQLSSLRQERAELTEKLARLERLHQGFELSSSEKIQSLEKELEILMQQKLALEAQVQEQSDLLIKEKEKEKEIEQARVSEGIERITIELAAVRTAERFASDKVMELAKERDTVAEKVVKLEQRLEKLNECKVGQEQSLTGKIEELTREKQDLESQLLSLKSEMGSFGQKDEVEDSSLKERYDELEKRYEALKEKSDNAAVRIAELEAELAAATKDKSFDEGGRQELEAQMATLKAELQAKSKKLDIAQGQAQAQRTIHTEKVTQLTSQIQSLTTERDSLSQPKLELESQLRDVTEQAAALEQKLKVMSMDNERLLKAKSEAQEQNEELNSRLSAFSLKERDHKEALALAKDTIHQRDEELSSTHALLQKAESSHEKSVIKLLKLEKEMQALVDRHETTKTSLTKAQQECKSIVSKSVSQQNSASIEFDRLKAKHVKTLQERDQGIEERDKLRQTIDANQKEIQMKQAELDTLQKMHEASESQVREYQAQLTESRNRVDTLEELTSIAKRVAEAKVVEFEALKANCSDLENELRNTKDLLRKKHDEYQETLVRHKEDIQETEKALGEKISQLLTQISQKNEEIEVLRTSQRESQSEIASVTKKLEEHLEETQRMETEIQELRSSKHDLELELKHFADLEELLSKEKAAHETAAEEFKMREGHLRTVNKTLKEEVRKLYKLVPGSPLPSPSFPPSPSPYTQNFPQTPGGPGGNSNGSQYQNTPGTPKPKLNGAGRAFSTPALGLGPTPPATPATPRFQRQLSSVDEDVNIEYIRNVLLNFLEHKERRQQLIPVVAQILKMSNDETKRMSRVA